MIVVEDLVQPLGPLDPELFPDDKPLPVTGPGSLDERLSSYIEKAKAKVAALAGNVADAERARLAWALHLGYEGAYMLRLAKPSTNNLGALGLPAKTYSSEQLKGLRILADQYAAAFEAELVSHPDASASTTGSGAAETIIAW